MATKQEIEKLALSLAQYMETSTTQSWDKWLRDFMKAPLTSQELALVRESAREITERRKSPVLREMK